MGKTIGIVSFKGGVGKTTTTINLGYSLYKKGKSVLVIDGNFLSPNLHLYLGLLQPKYTLKEILRKNMAVENAIYEHASGLHLLPCNFYKEIRLQEFKKLIENIKQKYDYTIIDSGPSYTEEILAILITSDDILFVATPDYASLASTVKAKKLAAYKGTHILGTIINKKRNKRYELNNKDIEQTLQMKVITEIPEDQKILKAARNFSPTPWKYKRAKSSKAYNKLATKIIKDEKYEH